MVQEWIRGARLRFTRNPYYHGPKPQHLDGVDILIGGDETTHLMMFERGELDIPSTEGIPMPSFRRLSHDPRWSADPPPILSSCCLLFHLFFNPDPVEAVAAHCVHDRPFQPRLAQGE